MFDIGAGEVLVLLIMGVLIFGPEKLPKVAADAGRLVRELRRMAAGARSQLGPEFENIDLSDLNPRTFVTKHLLDGEDFSVNLSLKDDVRPAARPATASSRHTNPEPAPGGAPATAGPTTTSSGPGQPAAPVSQPIRPAPFDLDAT